MYCLSSYLPSEPASISIFCFCQCHKLTYFIRTLPALQQHIGDFDHVIDTVFIPAITDGHICSDDKRLLLSLPAKMGGLALPVFSSDVPEEYRNSQRISKQSSENMKQQKREIYINADGIKKIKSDIQNNRQSQRDAILFTRGARTHAQISLWDG